MEIEPLVRENHLQNIRINIFTNFSSNCEFKTSIFRQGIHVLLQIYHVIDLKGTHDIIFDIRIYHVIDTEENHDIIDITTIGVPLAEASYEDGCPQWPRRS